ncbi:M48 family metalloprotease [Diaminobutyricimonas sp. LJ205]|uniref:M48 family metalloprotease n=1 Tax=Diaminobutyricimonas sp. LJ205 TaxID=2683590 RepID=UPI0012F492AF|nr:M48 family metalloprotease [Diaminobutyricimonas sp. LJ205]
MYRQIARNKRWSVTLIVFFALVITGIGAWLSISSASVWPLVVLLAFCGVYVWWQLRSATKHAARSAGCVEVGPSEEPRLHRVVDTLAIRAGIPKPIVCVIEDDAANAFAAAMRPDDAVVGVTRGTLRLLDDTELEGVIAHEVAHIVNYDSRVKITTFALVGSVAAIAAALAFIGWALIGTRAKGGAAMVALTLGIGSLCLAAIFGTAAFLLGPLISSGVSRQREYLADASAAELTRHPDGLSRALRKIEAQGSQLARPVAATSQFFFANPLRRGWLSALLDSHPSTAKRVERLTFMEANF